MNVLNFLRASDLPALSKCPETNSSCQQARDLIAGDQISTADYERGLCLSCREAEEKEKAEAARVNEVIVTIIREMADYDGAGWYNTCGFCKASLKVHKHKEDCVVLAAQKLAHEADIRLLADIREEDEDVSL